MICDTLKYIHIHIPKTAGVTVANVLKLKNTKAVCTAHHNLAQTLHRHPGKENYYKFTFIRNPYDRMVSLYEFWKQQTPKHEFYKYDGEQSEYINNKNLSFSNFIDEIYNQNYIFTKKPHVYAYYPFYFSENQQYDYIGRVETISKDLHSISKALNVNITGIPMLNTCKRVTYVNYYNTQSKTQVSKLYERDLDMFEYTFDNEL